MTADWLSFRKIRRGGRLPALLAAAGLLGGLLGNGRAATTLPAASEVTARMVKRAQAVAERENAPQYTYEKRSVLEHLDSAGRTVKSEQKVYEVRLIHGLPFNRLVRVQGRELTAEELKKEEERAERFRKRFVSADRKKLAARREALVTPELLDRYEFEVKERIVLSNRPTLVVTFKPKDGSLPSKSVEDKLLNRMAGTVWIDEAEAEAARVVVNLVKPLSMGWFGWIGSLHQCDLTLERARMPDGAWVNSRMTLFIQCRKLLSPVRVRLTEESGGFKRVLPGE